MDGTSADIRFSELLWPVGLGFFVLFLYILSRLLLKTGEIRDDNPKRGEAFFHAFFFAPDLAIFSISLVISSLALKAILNGKSIKTNFGESFSHYFFLLILGQIAVLILTSIIWLASDDRFKTFPLKRRQERRHIAGGNSEVVTVYRIDYFRGFFRKIGIWNLIVGNIFGICSVIAYIVFIYYGFSR